MSSDFVAPLRPGHETAPLSAAGARLLGLTAGIPVAGPYNDHEAGHLARRRHPSRSRSLGARLDQASGVADTVSRDVLAHRRHAPQCPDARRSLRGVVRFWAPPASSQCNTGYWLAGVWLFVLLVVVVRWCAGGGNASGTGVWGRSSAVGHGGGCAAGNEMAGRERTANRLVPRRFKFGRARGAMEQHADADRGIPLLPERGT